MHSIIAAKRRLLFLLLISLAVVAHGQVLQSQVNTKNLLVTQMLKYTPGNQAFGKVLHTDASGNVYLDYVTTDSFVVEDFFYAKPRRNFSEYDSMLLYKAAPNRFWAGPATGTDSAKPSYRAITLADLPAGIGGGAAVAGSNRQIQINDNGNFGVENASLDSGLIIRPKSPPLPGFKSFGITYKPTEPSFVYEKVDANSSYPSMGNWYRYMHVNPNQNMAGMGIDVNNPVFYEGYNRGPNGRVDPTKPAFGWDFETNFDTGADSVSNNEIHLYFEPVTQTNPSVLYARRLMSFWSSNGTGNGSNVGKNRSGGYMTLNPLWLQWTDSANRSPENYMNFSPAGIFLTALKYKNVVPTITITPDSASFNTTATLFSYGGGKLLESTTEPSLSNRTLILGGNYAKIATAANDIELSTGVGGVRTRLFGSAGGPLHINNLAANSIRFTAYNADGTPVDIRTVRLSLDSIINNPSPTSPAGNLFMNPIGDKMLTTTINGNEYRIPLIDYGGQTAYGGGYTMALGNTANRPTGWVGKFRANSDSGSVELYIDGIWKTLATRDFARGLSGGGGSGITGLIGDITATGTGSGVTATLATVNSNVGTFGSTTQVPVFTVNQKGLITAATNTSIQIAESQVTNLTTDLAAKAPIASPTFTGTATFSTAIATSAFRSALFVGGTSTSAFAKVRATTGAGAGSEYIAFEVGNNGNIEVMRITGSGAIGIGTATPATSSKLDIQSTTQGVLLPRMTTTEKNNIASPAEGLEVYDLTLHQKCYYNGTAWICY